MEQILIVVDEKDNFIEYASRYECHSGKGKHHRAIVIALIDDDKRILLQKRKAKLWDGYWDLTGATHTLHYTDYDESYEDACKRCLQNEWNINVPLMKTIGAFNYFAREKQFCENEYCSFLIGKCSNSPSINPEYAYKMRWITLDKLHQEVKSIPNQFTPWALLAIKMLNKKNLCI